ncbi:hypothetical protein ACKWRH_05680 [Bradyrhizobium sp. Pa8]|uniref:hypothetical protein n=1 Tax=Bradyrhizobium sp. Pa8 TaxID=3386552 RepID=UPI00403F03CD
MLVVQDRLGQRERITQLVNIAGIEPMPRLALAPCVSEFGNACLQPIMQRQLGDDPSAISSSSCFVTSMNWFFSSCSP